MVKSSAEYSLFGSFQQTFRRAGAVVSFIQRFMNVPGWATSFRQAKPAAIAIRVCRKGCPHGSRARRRQRIRDDRQTRLPAYAADDFTQQVRSARRRSNHGLRPLRETGHHFASIISSSRTHRTRRADTAKFPAAVGTRFASALRVPTMIPRRFPARMACLNAARAAPGTL